MRLLIDECLPRKLKFLFAEAGLECETVRDAGFSDLDDIRPHIPQAIAAIRSMKPQQIVEVGMRS